MKNLTLIIAFIIGTSFALSAQRDGSLNSNTNKGSNASTRGNSTISKNPNLGTASRGGSSKSGRGNDRPSSGRGNDRPNSYGNTNNGRPSNNGRGGGHHNNGHHNNNGHNGHNNNGHHASHNNGHHNNGHHNSHNNGHNGHHASHNNGHGHNGHHGNVNVVVSTGHGHGHGRGHNYNSYCNYSNHSYGWNAVCVTDFNIGCRTIRNCGYDADRLRSAKRFVRHNYVSSHQIADIMLMFSFESSRLEFAKYAFHRTCDVQNYGIVFDQLAFNSSRRDLDCYVRDFQW
jgi:hypothetical protein